MAINHLIGIGAGVVGGKNAVEMWLAGSYETVIGNDARNCIGGRATHIYGDDTKLVFGGSLLGPVVGPFVDAFTGGWVGGDVTYNYGQQVDLVYGGPIARITRGPTIQKTNFRQLADVPTKFSLGALFAAVQSNKANRPTLPAPDVTPSINIRAFNPEVDAAYEKPILAASIALTALTAAADLTIRFTYPNYQADLTNPDKKADPVSKSVRLVTQLVTNTLMGLIYQMELLSIHDNDAANAQSGVTTSLGQMLRLVKSGALPSKDHIKTFLKRAGKFLLVLVYNTIMLAVVAAIVAVIVGVVAGVLFAVSKA